MNKKYKSILIGGIAVLVLVFLDQMTKSLAVKHLMGNRPYVLIQGVFELQYLENFGAAFGMLQNKQWFFFITTIFIVSLMLYGYLKLPFEHKYRPLRICIAGITAGAVGNLIDRVFSGYVVDFLYFRLIDFPVFNVADCYVTIFTALLAILVLFRYKEEDLEFFTKKKVKE